MMDTPIRYYSTNRKTPTVTLREAVLCGQAPDRGLFMPQQLPRITWDELAVFKSQSYAQVAHAVLRKFTTGSIDDQTLMALCLDAYDFAVPLEQVTEKRYILRLDQGPTASFKDFAARMMARWMNVFMASEDGGLLLLTATSGDTGSAVAHAYHGVDRIRVVVLFPAKEVSDRQRRQMTTIGGNVTTFAVEGKFDDCQAMVKQAFADQTLSAIRLTSANSINIARLLPQTVYYVYAYAQLANVGAKEPIIISVPSGNFGNMMGAVLAKAMGLPIHRLIIATNANDEVPTYLRTGDYHKLAPSRVCVSNAMNVGHPSNLARLVDRYGGWMDETGTIRKAPDLASMRRDLYTVSINDVDTRSAILEAHQQHGLLLEPHGAVGWAGLGDYFGDHPEDLDVLAISVETAHPAKFPELIQETLGLTPEVPPSLIGLDQREEQFETITSQYESFRDLLVQRY